MPREKSAGAIIYREEPASPGQGGEGKIYYLLLHYPAINRKGGHWEFAKGHVEKNETEEQTIKREVQEETGLEDIEILPGFKEYIKYFFKAKQNPHWIFKLVIFYVARTNTKEIKLSPEHIGFDWLPFDQAFKKITYKNSKELLKKANEFIIQRKNL